ncbi:MAG: DUF2971 domain-containing protein [Desulfuromonadales bacterium]|nr:DUF2971 domain-containing protein [Desulfuromonadales bacterium]
MFYHYTTLEGLKGIIQDRIFFATQAPFLNDESEVRHTFDLLRDILNKKMIIQEMSSKRSGSYEPFRGQVLTSLVNVFSNPHALINPVKSYICSFTRNGNLLSQWRAYGGNNGSISIGFDEEQLKKFCKEQGMSIFECVYEHEKKRVSINEQVEKFLQESYLKNGGSFDQELLEQKFEQLTMEIFHKSLFFKHHSFHEEKEHRIVCHQKLAESEAYGIKFRTGDIGLIPYVCLPILQKLPIGNIYIGPNKNSHLIKIAVDELLEKEELKIFGEIISSDIPYRT